MRENTVTKVFRSLKRNTFLSVNPMSGLGTLSYELSDSDKKDEGDGDNDPYTICTNAGGAVAVANTMHRLPGGKAQSDTLIDGYKTRYGVGAVAISTLYWNEISDKIGLLDNRTADYLRFDLFNNVLTHHAGIGTPPPSYLDFSCCLLWGIYMKDHASTGNPEFAFTTGWDASYGDTLIIHTGVAGEYYDFSNTHP
jgi:hypothetical protein